MKATCCATNHGMNLNLVMMDMGLKRFFKGIHPALLKLVEWNRQIAVFTSLTIDDQAKLKLIQASWCEHCTLKVVNQLDLETDAVDAVGKLGVLRREISHWRHLQIDCTETACLKAYHPIQFVYSFSWKLANCNFRSFCCGFDVVVDVCFPSSPETEGLSRPSLSKVEKLQEEALHAIKLRAKDRHPVYCTLRVSKLLLCLWAIQRLSLELRSLRNLLFILHLRGNILYIFVAVQTVNSCMANITCLFNCHFFLLVRECCT